MAALPRLRQVALVARDLAEVAGALREAFGWAEPFHDPGVGEFGLHNSVFAAGDTFLEVVSPVREGTTAGRYLDSRGGDSGYMAIFQVDGVAAARQRAAEAGVRVVWKVDLDDISGTHLHPKDTPGAIVSLDWADPVDSWRWAGSAWTGGAAATTVGGAITGLTVEVADPAAAAGIWAAVLGIEAGRDGRDAVLELDGGAQQVRFVPTSGDRGEGITVVRLAASAGAPPVVEVCGVRFETGTED